jgi:predicted lactoylglutathione lyase
MTKTEYIHGLLQIIRLFADPNYQYREWVCFETNPYASYEETMCMLYDASRFEEILENADQFEFSEKQLHKLQQFHKILRDFDDQCYVEVEEMIKQNGWQKVVKAAQDVLAAFADYKVKNDTEPKLKEFP